MPLILSKVKAQFGLSNRSRSSQSNAQLLLSMEDIFWNKPDFAGVIFEQYAQYNPTFSLFF